MDTSSIKQYTSQSCASQLQSAPTTAGGCNGAVKPRVRARRGQATDPHSIAERVSTILFIIFFKRDDLSCILTRAQFVNAPNSVHVYFSVSR